MDKFIAEQRYIELIPSAFTEEKFSFCDKIRLNDDYFLKNFFLNIQHQRKQCVIKLQEGTYTHMVNHSLLHSKMSSYYKDLSITNLGDEPVFSVPYVDERSAKTGKAVNVSPLLHNLLEWSIYIFKAIYKTHSKMQIYRRYKRIHLSYHAFKLTFELIKMQYSPM